VIDAGLMRRITQTTAWVTEHAEGDALVFLDTAAGCPNTEGQRFCEKQVGLSALVRRPYLTANRLRHSLIRS
jgi:hypothetical protein